MTTRMHLRTFSIALGITGLAELWDAGVRILGAPHAIAEAFWIVAVGTWVALVVLHAWRGAAAGIPLASQLRDPVQLPLAALAPVTGMLLGIHVITWWAPAGLVMIIGGLAIGELLAALLVARLLRGDLPLAAVHGGTLIPVAAVHFVGAVALALIGLPRLATALLGAGVLLWLPVVALIVARLAAVGPLPLPLTPTLAILAAPPAVAGLGAFLTAGGTTPLVLAFAGLSAVSVLVQLGLVARYLAVPASVGHFAFTFPVAYTALFALLLVEDLVPQAAPVTAVALLAVTTAFTAFITLVVLRSAAGRANGTAHVGRADVGTDTAATAAASS